jgi:stress response protein SCP2
MAAGTGMVKGANVAVPATSVTVEVRWTAGVRETGVDASALLLGRRGKVRSDADFVFYNQPAHPSGALWYLGTSLRGDDTVDRLEVRLDKVEESVARVLLTASVHRGWFTRVAGLRLVLLDGDRELAHFPVTGASTEKAMILGELYRRGTGWKLRAVGQGYASGLRGLATDYGISVDDGKPQVAEGTDVPAGEAGAPAQRLPAVDRLATVDPRAADLADHAVAWYRYVAQHSDRGSYAFRTASQALERYLPDTIAAFLDLPREWARTNPLRDGRSPLAHFQDQLLQLAQTAADLYHETVDARAQAILVNGGFLSERLGPGSL